MVTARADVKDATDADGKEREELLLNMINRENRPCDLCFLAQSGHCLLQTEGAEGGPKRFAP